ATMIGNVIRGFIGFEGLLMSDDVSMGALSGSIAERTRAALAAGCDLVLHCNGQLAEMEQVAAAAPPLAGEAAPPREAAFGGAAMPRWRRAGRRRGSIWTVRARISRTSWLERRRPR